MSREKVIYASTGSEGVVDKRKEFIPISQYQINEYIRMQAAEGNAILTVNSGNTSLFIASSFSILAAGNSSYSSQITSLDYSFSDENNYVYVAGRVVGTHFNAFAIPGATPTSSTAFLSIMNSFYTVNAVLFFIPSVSTDPAPIITGFRLLRNTKFGNRLAIVFRYTAGFQMYSTVQGTVLATRTTPAAASIGITVIEYVTHQLIAFQTPTAQVGPVYIQGGDAYAAPYTQYSPTKIQVAYIPANNGGLYTVRLPAGSSMTWLGQSVSNATANPAVSLWVIDYNGSHRRHSPNTFVDYFYNVDTDGRNNGYALVGAETTQTLFGATLAPIGADQNIFVVKFSTTTWAASQFFDMARPLGPNTWLSTYLPFQIHSVINTQAVYVFQPTTAGNVILAPATANIAMEDTGYPTFLSMGRWSFDGNSFVTNAYAWDPQGNGLVSSQVDKFGNMLFDGTFYNMQLPAPIGAISNGSSPHLLTMIIDNTGTVAAFNNITQSTPSAQSYSGISTVDTQSNFFSILTVETNTSPVVVNGVPVTVPADGNTYTNLLFTEYGIVYRTQ